MQADGKAKHQEGHDLGQAGQGAVEPFDLPLVGGAGVPGQNAGDEHGQEPRAMRNGGRPIDDQGPGQDPQWIQPLAGQRHPAHEPHQQRPASHPDHGADRQLEQKLDGDAAGGVQARSRTGGQQAGQQRDPDWVIHAGLAFQDGPAASGHLPAPQHREHHGRVGRGQGAAEQRCPPVQVEQGVREDGQSGGGDEGANDSDPGDRTGGGAESPPADVHPAVEQDHHQRHRDDPLDGGDRQLPQRRDHIRCNRGSDQDDRRCRDPDSFADLVEQHRRGDGQANHQHQQREVLDITHRRAPPWLPRTQCSGHASRVCP
jgi:hypothetical protein